MQFKYLPFIIFLPVLYFSLALGQESHFREEIQSPDKTVSVVFELKDGEIFYSVNYRERLVISPSQMGFILKDVPSINSDFNVISSEKSEFAETWQPVWGTSKTIRNHYNELFVRLIENSDRKAKLDICFRVFDDGVGFRYIFPEQDNLKKLEILSEQTQFRFTDNHKVWWIPANYDSYEMLYQGTPLGEMQAANTPVTIETTDGIYLSLSEADLTDYAEMTLKPVDNEDYTLECDLVPWPDGIKVKATTPHRTPWRTIQIAEQPGELIESHLILNLNEPCKIEDTSWIEPMKYVGIWWGMHIGKYTWHAGTTHGATTENVKRYIDFASENGIKGMLIEGWNQGWETWLSGINMQDYLHPYPDFDLEEVVRYADENGVKIIGHHETGGNVPEYERQVEEAFDLYEKLGIHAVKTGYAGKMWQEGMYHHGQYMVNHYRKIVKLAAEHHIMIDAHEPIKPTGISRTYPNMLTREGVRGMEYNAWSEGNPPEHTTILPFTRMLAGPLDYTPGIFNLRFDEHDNYRVSTTLAKQLAYYVILYSPLQMAADLVENYVDEPAFKFIQDVPVTWDDTHILNGKIGDYISIARKSGDEWFIGSITDENPRILEIPLNFLDSDQKYKATVYSDALGTDWENNPAEIEIGKYSLKSEDNIKVALSPSGGIAVKLSKIDADSDLPNIMIFNETAIEKISTFGKVSIYGIPERVPNIAIDKNIKLTTDYSSEHTGGGDNALIDGIRGEKWRNKYWQGYLGNNLEAVIDLGELTKIHRISVGFLERHPWWIFLPTEVKISISKDGKKYKSAAKFEHRSENMIDFASVKDFTIELKDEKVRFIRLKAVNQGSCPDWHRGAGNKAWLMVDEIIVE